MRAPVFEVDATHRRRLRARWFGLAVTAACMSSLVAAGALHVIVASGVLGAVVLLALAVPDTSQAPPEPTQRPPADPALVRWQPMLDGLHAPALILDNRDIVIGSNGLADAILPHAQGQVITAVCRAPELLDAVASARTSGAQQACHIPRLSPYHEAAVAIVTPLAQQPTAGQAALLIAIRDLTEQEKLSRMRSDFVANASHELRTPLTSLKGFIETLQGPAKDDSAARERFLAIMGQQASRMSRLIDDLLSLSRVEMKEHLRPTDHVNIAALFDEVIQDATPAAQEAGIALSCLPPSDGGGSGPVLVVGDRDELRLMLQNLVQNAIKYGRRGGRVELSAGAPESQRLPIRISDNGLGIAAEHLPRLTERFYRVSGGESATRGGTGLGLAIVKHIVNRHRGELSITSELGVGSTFTVKLPILR